MKKSTIIISIYLLLGICILTPLLYLFSLDGYYRYIDWARNSQSEYVGEQYVFSEESDNDIIDFVINSDEFHVVIIDCKEDIFGKKYNIKEITTYSIDKIIAHHLQNNEYNWVAVTNLLTDKEIVWCITSTSFHNNEYEYFEFEYNDDSFRIYYKVR